MQSKFRNEKIAFTEILFVGEETSHPEMNHKIKNIKERIGNVCEQNDYIFVHHVILQKSDCDLYDDLVHINRTGGTASFVSDIHRAVGLHAKPQSDSDHQGQVYRSQIPGRNDGRRGAAGSSDGGIGTGRGRGNRQEERYKYDGRDQGQNINVDQMLKLLTLNMLQQMQFDNNWANVTIVICCSLSSPGDCFWRGQCQIQRGYWPVMCYYALG